MPSSLTHSLKGYKKEQREMTGITSRQLHDWIAEIQTIHNVYNSPTGRITCQGRSTAEPSKSTNIFNFIYYNDLNNFTNVDFT